MRAQLTFSRQLISLYPGRAEIAQNRAVAVRLHDGSSGKRRGKRGALRRHVVSQHGGLHGRVHIRLGGGCLGDALEQRRQIGYILELFH